jgi:autotransporter-associated beta strand protein
VDDTDYYFFGDGTIREVDQNSELDKIFAGEKTNLRKAGTGTAVIATDNSFTGGTILENGRIVMQHRNALGTGGIQMMHGAVLQGDFADDRKASYWPTTYGNVYTGEVVSIGDFPTDQDNWNGVGNPTVSYYPFKAFVSEEADLEAGSHVSMSYSPSAAEQGIYLDKAFVRTEKGESYIYVRGAEGKLEKRTVRVGKVLWGSYYEILSGLSETDYLAFPYDKDLKTGLPTVESDLSVLYGY